MKQSQYPTSVTQNRSKNRQHNHNKTIHNHQIKTSKNKSQHNTQINRHETSRQEKNQNTHKTHN